MAKKTKRQRAAAQAQPKSQPAPEPAEAPAPAPTATPTAQPARPTEGGFFLNAANWILSRFPVARDHYQAWGKTKRIVIGLLLYLVALPIIPIVIAIIWYVRDPEGFKRSKLMPALLALIVAWFGGFGLLAMQPPTPDTNKASTGTPAVTESKDNSDTATGDKVSESKKKVANQTTSAPTLGQTFKNCDAAFNNDVFNIPRSDPSYRPALDGDNDGVACEK